MFTVVIPIYNHVRYLEAAVLSAFRSSLVQEILLVDDGSSDGSAALAGHFARVWPDRVKDLTKPESENRGAHERLNELCRSASCEWIAVLNSDDEFLPGRFDLLRRLILATKADFICGALLLMDEVGSVTGSKRGIRDPEYAAPSTLPKEPRETTDIRRLLCNQNFIATTSNMVFSKDLFHRIGGFSNLRYCHDWEFALRATMLGRCLYTPNHLTKYRTHNSNTIKEASAHADGEVVRLFARFLNDFAGVEKDALCREGLSANFHLGPSWPLANRDREPAAPPDNMRALRIGLTVPPSERLRESCLPVNFVSLEARDADSPWDKIDYLYAPKTTRIPDRALGDALLCLSHFHYDFILFTESLDELPVVKVGALQDHLIFNQRAARCLNPDTRSTEPLTGRVIRCIRGVETSATEQDIRTLFPGCSMKIQGSEILIQGGVQVRKLSRSMARINLKHLFAASFRGKPLVLVIPVFLAVGGVERNTVEILRQLRAQYDFLVVTTERFNKSQGSLHFQLDELGIRTFDLGEVSDPGDHLDVLESLSHLFPPDIVWICNGSPWLVAHSKMIRRLFAWSSIIDQEAYDVKEGWISEYHNKGIQSYDRFVAANKRIYERFLHHFRIPAQRVDLIYPAINSVTCAEGRSKPEIHESFRRDLNLPHAGYCFGFVGRLTLQKQPLKYLALALRAQNTGFDDHFLLIGQGDLADACNTFISTHNLRNVRCIPFYKDVATVVELMDGLIITSDYEGLPIILLESLALGKPALSTDVGDIKLILDEYGAGQIFESSNEPDSLWDSFVKWRNQIETYGKVAMQQRAAVSARFSAERAAGLYHRAWSEAMDELRLAPRYSGGM